MKAENFWNRVDTNGPMPTNKPELGRCWMWTGSKQRQGYGMVYFYGGLTKMAHRMAYEFIKGPIPEGLTLDHLCRNHPCVNPNHLEPVTNRENILRGTGPTALHIKKTHCPYGHEYSPQNTAGRKGRTGRWCRECKRVTDRRRDRSNSGKAIRALAAQPPPQKEKRK